MKELMLAGATSNVGKTTISLGFIQAFINKGLTVQPYKVGPDYVDTGFHTKLCGRESINLDEFMVEKDEVLMGLYLQGFQAADIALTEGVMGLYDGLGSDKLYCSSAGLALTMDIPILLIIDGSGTSTSAAALVKGFIDLEPRLNIIGIIVNKISSENHFKLIKKAVEKYNDVRVLGYIEKNNNIAIPSKKKGLVPQDEIDDLKLRIDYMADQIERNVDLDGLLDLMGTDKDPSQARRISQDLLKDYHKIDGEGLRLAYAYDKAFCFYYPQNLSLLEKRGVSLIKFSPLNDSRLPDADGYYFGGGYPGIYRKELEGNLQMRRDILGAHMDNKPIIGEGEALMYLGSDIIDDETSYEMVGIFSGSSYKTDRMTRFGYASMTLEEDIGLAKAGEKIRGHEYHYSDFHTKENTVGQLEKHRDNELVASWRGGYKKLNSFASFLQFHLYQDPSLGNNWIQALKDPK